MFSSGKSWLTRLQLETEFDCSASMTPLLARGCLFAQMKPLALTNAKVLTRWRLGSELHTPGELICQLCGDHLVCCNRNGMIWRHNAIVSYLSKFATVARVPHRVECGSDPDSRARPGDLTLLHWKGQGPHYLDVTITHPLSISSTWSSIHNGMECFDEVEKSKRQKYSGMIGNIEQNYTVFAMSTFGRLSEAAETFVSDLVAFNSTTASSPEEKEDKHDMFKQQLQMKFQVTT